MSEVVPTLITLTHLVGMSLGSENKALLTIYIECEGPMTPLPSSPKGADISSKMEDEYNHPSAFNLYR